MPLIDPDPLTDALLGLFRGKPTDSSLPRDSAGVRWAKFLSIIVVFAVVIGGLFAISIYVVALLDLVTPRSWHPLQSDYSVRDTMPAFWHRFVFGACVGGGLGFVYVIRCLIKKIDP